MTDTAPEFDYIDLVVDISQAESGGYRVMAAVGESRCHGTLELPDAVGTVLTRASQTIRPSGMVNRDGASETPEPPPAAPDNRDLGVQLFKALFRDEIRSLFDQTVRPAGGSANRATRIKLFVAPEGDGMAHIASLPWELIAESANDSPLALSRRTPVVRSFDLRRPPNPIDQVDTLRILRIVSNPKGTAPLNLDEERARLDSAFGQLPNVVVDDLTPPTVEKLQEVLRDHDYHVIHYMGHGTFSTTTGKGALLFESAKDGTAVELDADALEQLLADEPMTRLVYLSACRTAQVSDKQGANPFAGIAPALLKAGVPAVVAMQYPISDDAAIVFARTFYMALMKGMAVDAAVSEGRKALSTSTVALLRREWATPVLYMRALNGALFPRREPLAPPGDAAPAASTPGVSSSTPADRPFTVFLASTSSLVRPIFRQVATDLEGRGIKVLKDVPTTEKEHDETVRAYARDADLFVHIIGDQPGEPIEDGDGKKTYVAQQLEIGLEAARSQLILIPSSVVLKDAQDTVYRDYITAVLARPRDTHRFEWIQTDRHLMGDAVIAKRDRLLAASREEAARAAASSAAAVATGVSGAITAYVDLQKSDIAYATPLAMHLLSREIEARMKTADDTAPTDPAEAQRQFEDNVRNSRLFIVMYGAADRNKVLSRAMDAMKIAALSQSKTNVGVYVAPPAKSPEQLSFPPFVNIAHCEGGFDAALVDAWIRVAVEHG